MNPDVHMQHTAWRIATLIFLLSWLSQLPYLFPIPDLAKMGSTDPIEATKATGWIISAVLVVFGLVASFAGMGRKRDLKRLGLVLMLLSSAAYAVVWWRFSGYFDVNISLTKLFADLWSAAAASGRRLIFLHLDVVLLAYYHVMLVVLAFEIYRRWQYGSDS
jgi:hypothetical protein